MRNPTEMMREILTNKKAQEIIDYVSPIYGESYVALWLFQANGTVLDEICDFYINLRYEPMPATTTILLPYWEEHYAIPRDDSLTIEQRRQRLVAHISSRGPCNPTVLENVVSAALGGVKVEIYENISKNTFLVNVREPVKDLKPAEIVLDERKPAHLIYIIRVTIQTVTDAPMKTAVAVTHREKFYVEVSQ